MAACSGTKANTCKCLDHNGSTTAIRRIQFPKTSILVSLHSAEIRNERGECGGPDERGAKLERVLATQKEKDGYKHIDCRLAGGVIPVKHIYPNHVYLLYTSSKKATAEGPNLNQKSKSQAEKTRGQAAQGHSGIK